MMKLIKSFNYALKGLWYCIDTQRNFRIHLFAGVSVLILATGYSLSKSEISVLVLIIVGIMVCEMFNTAIEQTMDRISTEYDERIKIVKDVAAGAVLVYAMGAVIVGGMFFFERTSITQVIRWITADYIHLIGVIVYGIIGCGFIFFWDKWKGEK